jgi:acetylornithine deacetylase/succinyl-diaminopimelate desuccinylase-like protein
VPASPSTVRELLKSLVAFDTTSEKSNLRLIEFVRTYLDGFGIAATLIPAPDGMKANLLLDPSANAASGSQTIATAFQSRVRLGPAIRSGSSSVTASFMAAALAT